MIGYYVGATTVSKDSQYDQDSIASTSAEPSPTVAEEVSPTLTEEISSSSKRLLERACDFSLSLPNGFQEASFEKDSNHTCIVIKGTDPIGQYVPYTPKKITINVHLSSQKNIEDFLLTDILLGRNFNRGSSYFRRDKSSSTRNILLYERTDERTKYLRATYGGEEYVILVDKGQLIYEIYYKYSISNQDVDNLAENIAQKLKAL